MQGRFFVRVAGDERAMKNVASHFLQARAAHDFLRAFLFLRYLDNPVIQEEEACYE